MREKLHPHSQILSCTREIPTLRVEVSKWRRDGFLFLVVTTVVELHKCDMERGDEMDE